MIILLLFSLFAGFITVLSPCILPILPILLGLGAAVEKRRAWGIVIGLILSFTFFSLTLKFIVSLTGISPNVLRYIALALIGILGISMLFPRLEKIFVIIFSGFSHLGELVQEKSKFIRSGFISGLVLGIALGLIWTPCAGPVLATVIAIVASSVINLKIILVLLFYSIGCAIPMFLIMYGGSTILNSVSFFSRNAAVIRKIFGILIVIGSAMIFFNLDIVMQQSVSKYLNRFFVEDNGVLKKELERLQDNENLITEIKLESKAPELVGINHWINSSPLTLASLKGKVVLVDFWTYSCINCVHSLPYLNQWYEKYKGKGFIIIGVHTPQFEYEKDVKNVEAAVKRFKITYPVALDNDYKTWNIYNNRYWPSLYLLDKKGVVKKIYFGAGDYLKTENMIQNLIDI
ncbi:TPA: cytochrome C biogenesis protein [Candidatus Dependentiae bacterium]|nr:MAG: Cytochrome c biogenesis protein [candidate division TM6 bacterium GW2011_GWF2_33_332]HBS48104.1 cytochrome C biogenesis protein [Candidatus Dependentiae bacterium]HBZ73528.1 cytochrome C biogenesis protein [Candidatus Dependentiae bacterium]